MEQQMNEKNMEGIQKGGYRIENARDWFSMCGLIKDSVKELEDDDLLKSEAESRLYVLRNKEGFFLGFLGEFIPLLVSITILASIVVFIVGWFIKYGDSVLMKHILNDLYRFFETHNLFQKDPSSILLMIPYVILAIAAIILGFVVYIGIRLVPIIAIIAMCSVIRSMTHDKKETKELEENLELLNDKISELVETLSIPISLIPPSYRNSDAIAYFYDCAVNGRANSVKEAIKAYDDYEHRKRMQQTADNIESMNRNQCELLTQIEENTRKPSEVIENHYYYYR